MVKFGELSDTEKQNFTEEVQKGSKDKSITEERMQLWPEDDDSMTKSYFNKTK